MPMYGKEADNKYKGYNGVKTAMTYNAANQLVQSVTGGETTKYSYDANGSLVKSENAGGARSYTYNALNLLESFTREDGYIGTRWDKVTGMKTFALKRLNGLTICMLIVRTRLF